MTPNVRETFKRKAPPPEPALPIGISISDLRRLTPRQASRIFSKEWFEEALAHRVQWENERKIEKARILKIAHPHLKRKRQLENEINKKVAQIRELHENEVATEGVKLGFELKALMEESNRVNRLLGQLGFGCHIFDKIPNNTTSMLSFIQQIRDKKIFRPAKKE